MSKQTRRLFTIGILFIVLSSFGQKTRTLLFIGSYTRGEPSTGIYVYEFDTENGSMKKLSEVDTIINPSFINLSSNGKYLYACTETKLMKHKGILAAFKIDSINGQLTLMNKVSAEGENPVYVSVGNSDNFLVNANYDGANLSVFSLKKDGSLNKLEQLIQFKDSGIIKQRQERSHPHAAVISPEGKFVCVPDLGADKIRVFEIMENKLKERKELTIATPPGAGPRHLVFHPNGKFAYCTGELNGNILSYSYSDGKLTFIQTLSSYSKEQPYYATSDIHVSPDGKFLYASNRGEENSISVFSINDKGRLIRIGQEDTGGKHPRFFNIDPSGKFLAVANVETGNVIVFKRDPGTGLLTKTGTEIKVFAPSCIQFRIYKLN
jgi:6-phosphogluconolactonase